MLSVEERLRSSDEGFPAHAVDPSSSVGRVVRRGRVRLALARAGTGLATVAVVAAGVVTVPQLVAPPSPKVVSPVIDTSDEAPEGKRELPAEERDASKYDRGKPSDLAFVPDRPVEKEVVEEEPVGQEKTDEPVVVKEPAPKPEPEPEPKTRDPAPATDFTAHQWQTHVEHDPPYNKYHGTAAPGTEIRAGNEYGSASGVADEKGNWYVKVWFEDAPYGTHTFTVVVESSEGQRQTFEMTATRPEKSEQVAFTANQKYASSDAEPPSNLYWGTAAPNSQVNVMSEYGSVETMADADGNWETHLVFEKAPAGTTTFTVKVKSLATGEYVFFEMTTIR